MRRKIKTTRYDPAEYLTTPRDMEGYMSEALATGDPAFIADALGVIARAKGMTEIARRTGLGRENLYRTLSKDGNPELATVIKVMQALGLNLRAKAM